MKTIFEHNEESQEADFYGSWQNLPYNEREEKHHTKHALIILLLTAGLIMLVAFSSAGQTQKKDSTRTITTTWTTKIPDTCKVYTGARGGKFVFLKSKKSGKIYKSYFKK